MSLWPKPIISSHWEHHRRQEQGIRQLIDGSGHIAVMKLGRSQCACRRPARSSAVSGRKLARLTPEAVQAIALSKSFGNNSGANWPIHRRMPACARHPARFHRTAGGSWEDNLFGPTRTAGSLVHDSLAGLRSSVHSRIPFPVKSENAAGRIPGISIPASVVRKSRKVRETRSSSSPKRSERGREVLTAR